LEVTNYGENQTAPPWRQEGSFLPRCGSGLPFPRDGRFIEEIGTYNPCVSPAEIKIDTERAQAWIKSGAQPTDTVRALLKKVEVL